MRLLLVLALSATICCVAACAVDVGPDPGDDPAATGISGAALTGPVFPSDQVTPLEPDLVVQFPDKHDPADQPWGPQADHASSAADVNGDQPHIVGRVPPAWPRLPPREATASGWAGAYSSNSNIEHRLPPPPPCITCPRDLPGIPSTRTPQP